MRYYLMKMTTRGIKNIENDLIFYFYPQTITDSLRLNNTNIKSIYGMNGSGKSAIMKSVEMYKNLISKRNYLSTTSIKYLNNFINKKTNSFYCEMIYSLYDEANKNKIIGVFSHSIFVDKLNESYMITSEKFSELTKKSKTLNGEYKIIFETKNGNLEINKDKFGDLIKEKTLNLLTDASLFALIPGIQHSFGSKEFNKIVKDYEYANKILFGAFFNTSLHVFIDNEDQYTNYINDNKLIINEYVETLKKSVSDTLVKKLEKNFDVNFKIVKKTDSELYEKEIKKLEAFVKNFKPSLIKINYEKKIDKDNYIYSLIFDYEEYSIDSEFESTGIKKLIKLFQYFQYVADGNIVFIDELDANLHDVYLSKLIQYINKYTSGQLCFTSHNLSTMNEVKNYKNSIDFLSETIGIIPWVKNGNYTPFSQYRNGMIKGSPFNIEDFDFIKVFGSGDNEC